VSLGTQPHIVERLLNHASGRISGVAAVYNRYQYMDEMRAALERWESKLTRLLQSATSPPAPRAKLVSGRADPIYGSLANDDLARELL